MDLRRESMIHRIFSVSVDTRNSRMFQVSFTMVQSSIVSERAGGGGNAAAESPRNVSNPTPVRTLAEVGYPELITVP